MAEVNEESLEKRLIAVLGTIERSGHPSEYYNDQELVTLLKIDPLFIQAIRTKERERKNKEAKEEKALEMAGLGKPEEIFKSQGQVKFYIKEQPIFYDKNCLWWVWNKNLCKWEISDEVDILNHIERITGEDIITPKNRTLILNSLKQECRKTIPASIKPTWIQFKDKIYDVKTGDIFDASPNYFITNPIPYELNQNNFFLTPMIDKIFEEWVGKEKVPLLYEIIAYCLLPDYPIHRLFCLIGAGMNGKSCFLRLLEKFVGKENTTSVELDELIHNHFAVTKLYKKLVCMMGETNFNEISQTSTLKKLTGQDLIGFEYKNKNPFEDHNYSKIIISTNNLPSTTDKTMGFYRRWCIVDFPNQFSEEKDILKDIPEEEYTCLSLKCAMLLKDILDRRKFTNEGTIEERREKYEEKSNFLDKFIKFFIEDDFEGYITVADFNRKFSDWCRENRNREMSETTIGMELKKKGWEAEKKYFQWMFEGKGGQIRCWMGKKWKN